MGDTLLIAVIAGLIMDSLVGDPYWMPHPIRVFGNSISLVEKILNKNKNRKIKGAVAWIILVSITFIVFFLLDKFLLSYPIVWAVFTSLFVFWGLSSRCLIVEGVKVEQFLMNGDLEGARKQLSMIVGRDTSQLSETKIRSAVIETLAENLSDGVIAPLLFFAIGGVPFMMMYKMINTLDSMVGYKNDRYMKFGYVSAKMDDVANFIPARLTALFIVIVSVSVRALKFIFKYGNSHSSPNAGYPESAMAGVLDIRLGGASNYFGKMVEKPYIGYNDRELLHKDVVNTCLVNAKVSFLAYIVLLILIFNNVLLIIR